MFFNTCRTFIVFLFIFNFFHNLKCQTQTYTPCQDKYKECALWKKANLCSNNAYKDYLSFNCPITCNICSIDSEKETKSINTITISQQNKTYNASSLIPSSQLTLTLENNKNNTTGTKKSIFESIKNITDNNSASRIYYEKGYTIKTGFNTSTYTIPVDSNNIETFDPKKHYIKYVKPNKKKKNNFSKRSDILSFRQKFINSLKGKKTHKQKNNTFSNASIRQDIQDSDDSTSDSSSDNTSDTTLDTTSDATDTTSDATDTTLDTTDTTSDTSSDTLLDNVNYDENSLPNETDNNVDEISTTILPDIVESNTTETEETMTTVVPIENETTNSPTFSQLQETTTKVTSKPEKDIRTFKMVIKESHCSDLKNKNSPKYKLLTGNIIKEIEKYLGFDAKIKSIKLESDCQNKDKSKVKVIFTVEGSQWTIKRFNKNYSQGHVGKLIVVPNTLTEILK